MRDESYRFHIREDEITHKIRYTIGNLWVGRTKKLLSGGFTTEDSNEFIRAIIEVLRISLKDIKIKDKKICSYCHTKLERESLISEYFPELFKE